MYGGISWLTWVETNLFACVWVRNIGTQRLVRVAEGNVKLSFLSLAN
jgi:hypothetical protein